MLNLPSCVTLASISSTIFRQLFDWLTTPALIIPLISVSAVLPWCFRRNWKRRTWKRYSATAIVLLLVYLTLLSPQGIAASSQLLVRLLPADTGTPADAIVVLGRGASLRPPRVELAAELWRNHRAPTIFTSGWGDAMELAALLEERGIPKAAINGEPCSRTTEENARFTAAILQPRHIHRIVLVTDAPHMLRSRLTFRSLGFEVIPQPHPLPNDLTEKKQAFLVLREYAGLVVYGLKGRYASRTISEFDRAEVAFRSPIQ